MIQHPGRLARRLTSGGAAIAAGAMAAALLSLPAAGSAAASPKPLGHASAGSSSAGSSSAGSSGAGSSGAHRIGGVDVRRCAAGSRALCGSIRVPLDYSSAASPQIRIGFRWLPATGSHGASGKHGTSGTVLAVEGGPGYSSTGSASLYRAMLGPLLRTRNLLLVNLRGTGNSTPVRCAGLEHAGPHQYGVHFDKLVAACGAQLNRTWRYRGGGWVHASDLFNTANSARDVAGLLRALRIGRVDLYGDSYGSWFSQVFASRYPGLLRSLTLDSTYQVLGLDPWYTTTVVTARHAFGQACARSAACAAATRGSAWDRIAHLERRLARAPVSGETTTADGTPGRVTVTALTLVDLVNNAGFDPVVYQDLDAAGRALRHGDATPLLRLAALSVSFDDTNEPLNGFSDGLYFAVACTDYVQLFDRGAAPAARARQYRAALRREPRGTFAPFSVTQWTELDQYTEAYSACLRWPTPKHANPPITRRPPLLPARLPALILSGGFDSLTPRLRGATLVARQLGRSARLVTLANLTHVTEQDGNSTCAAAIYRRFVAEPRNLARQDTSCALRVAPIHAVGSYPARLGEATAATAAPGNQAGRTALRAVTVALASAGDEISRWPLISGNVDRGLRGGHVTFSGANILRIHLHAVRWVTNATVDGSAWWNQTSQRVVARLTVRPRHGAVVRLTARWRVFAGPGTPAVISGSSGRAHVAATADAP